MSCSVMRIELRIPSARGKGPYAPGDGVWSMVNPGERVEGYARRITAPGQARQTGESRVSRSAVPGGAAHQRAGGDTARWVRIITCQTADCGNGKLREQQQRYPISDRRYATWAATAANKTPHRRRAQAGRCSSLIPIGRRTLSEYALPMRRLCSRVDCPAHTWSHSASADP